MYTAHQSWSKVLVILARVTGALRVETGADWQASNTTQNRVRSGIML